MDTGAIHNANVKYAVYEALGNMQFLKGTVFLMDGLLEQDPLLLTAVMTSLDSQLNPGVIKKLFELIRNDEQQGQRLIQAIVTSRAMNIFENLYAEADIAGLLTAEIISMQDQSLIDAFQEKLTAIGSASAMEDARSLSEVRVVKGGKTILVVDDSKAMLAFFQATLSGFGLAVVTAENGKRANDLLTQGQHADLIFTDMNMPEMDGIEFTRLARKHAATQNTPVVMISTESETSQVELAKEAGGNGFLNKPFTKEKLKETVASYI
jgi:CheY-like chemotaxis protein